MFARWVAESSHASCSAAGRPSSACVGRVDPADVLAGLGPAVGDLGRVRGVVRQLAGLGELDRPRPGDRVEAGIADQRGQAGLGSAVRQQRDDLRFRRQQRRLGRRGRRGGRWPASAQDPDREDGRGEGSEPHAHRLPGPTMNRRGPWPTFGFNRRGVGSDHDRAPSGRETFNAAPGRWSTCSSP